MNEFYILIELNLYEMFSLIFYQNCLPNVVKIRVRLLHYDITLRPVTLQSDIHRKIR